MEKIKSCGCGCGILLIICAALLVSLLTQCTSNAEYKNTSVDTLCSEFLSNTARAKKNYKGKNLIISGNISGIQEDIKYITLYSVEYPNVILEFRVKSKGVKKKIMQLDTGDHITIRCKCKSVSSDKGYKFDIISME